MAAAVAACESVRLFAERAAASVPGFTVDDENAGAVAGIVDRLDGLPLAIELAAARVKLLPPAEILARLDNSLGLLVSSSRDLPARQRTLRATIAWSYELLSDSARQLLAACSVFRGGIALDVIESVCAGAAGLRIPVLDAAGELVDHSLLRQGACAPTASSPLAGPGRTFTGSRPTCAISAEPARPAWSAAHERRRRRDAQRTTGQGSGAASGARWSRSPIRLPAPARRRRPRRRARPAGRRGNQ